MNKTLILGYGNADREDDGVAWHVLSYLALRLGRPEEESFEEGFNMTGDPIELLFVLQLTPELAETVAEFERVIFIDAQTGAIPDEIQVATVNRDFQASPFTHHLTPNSLLAFADTLYGKQPEATLVSIQGYSFGFSRSLSPRTSELAELATEIIWNRLNLEE